MKNDDVSRFLLGVIAVGSLFLGIACGSAGQNQNQGMANSADPVSAASTVACTAPNLGQRRNLVKGLIERDVKDNGGLKNGVKFDVIEVDGALQVRFEGIAHGKSALNTLYFIVRDLMRDECVLSVLFVPDGTISQGSRTVGDNFEWTMCEDPQVPCPNGVCGRCKRLKDANSANTARDLDSDSNANANSTNTNRQSSNSNY